MKSKLQMKVIHTIPSIVNKLNGPSYSVTRLCESLKAHGCTVILASLSANKDFHEAGYIKYFSRGVLPSRLGSSPDLRDWLDSGARDQAVDLLHNHSLWMMPNVYPGWVAKRHHIPLVTSPRGTLSPRAMNSGLKSLKKIFWSLVQKPALIHTTCFHATSMAEYGDIRAQGFSQPVALIPNGIDIPPYEKLSNREVKTVLFLGRIHPIKGLDMLLPAWRVLQDRHPGWKLRIVGPDHRGYLREMKALASGLNLSRVEFVGPVAGAETATELAEADLFVLPSYSENFAISVAEALAAGLPAIVTKGAPWDGLVTHQAGWHIDIDTQALISAMDQAMNTPRAELQQMGLRGRQWMGAEFAWEKIAFQMAETYAWLLGVRDMPEWVIE
jgi:glycosyltransferase involved in cell wall biosynthesis